MDQRDIEHLAVVREFLTKTYPDARLNSPSLSWINMRPDEQPTIFDVLFYLSNCTRAILTFSVECIEGEPLELINVDFRLVDSNYRDLLLIPDINTETWHKILSDLD